MRILAATALAALMLLTATYGSQAEAHIPGHCNRYLNAASDANAQYNRATNAASRQAERLARNPTSPSLLGSYFRAAQTQAVAVGGMMQANRALVVCVSGR